MAQVEEPRSTDLHQLGSYNTFVSHAFFYGKISGLPTLKIFHKQHGDVHKVLFPYGYIFTSTRDTSCSFYRVADTNIAMTTASVRTLLQWSIKEAQPFSAARSLVNLHRTSLNKMALLTSPRFDDHPYSRIIPHL
jgi:hypothetical protein